VLLEPRRFPSCTALGVSKKPQILGQISRL
jgi:hypothetical protein